MMNSLFRNIKENNNLDLLEESDNEDEFENYKEDKFVYLEKQYNLICLFNINFKKWYPIRLATDNESIITLNELNVLEKNNYLIYNE